MKRYRAFNLSTGMFLTGPTIETSEQEAIEHNNIMVRTMVLFVEYCECIHYCGCEQCASEGKM